MFNRWILSGFLMTLWAASTGFAGIDECDNNSHCDDDNPCTRDVCQLSSPHTCVNTPLTNGTACNDGSPCTTNDRCSNGFCIGTFLCNDGNACTQDSCSTSGTCQHEFICSVSCCDDGNACTIDACNVNGDCVHAPWPCTSPNNCFIASCDPSSGCESTPRNCNDGNECTFDFCSGSCQHLPLKGTCDDGNACTTDDACSDGDCAGGPPLVCADDNGCTTDTCDPAAGCVFTDNSAPCDDADACTTDDTCAGGSCAGDQHQTATTATVVRTTHATRWWAASTPTIPILAKTIASARPMTAASAELARASRPSALLNGANLRNATAVSA